MSRRYRRYLALCEVPVSGVYRYRDIFQLLPAPEEAPRPPALFAAHPVVIEVAFEGAAGPRVNQWGQTIDTAIVNSEIGSSLLREVSLLLTALSSYHIFLCGHRQGWFIPLGQEVYDQGSHRIQWGQEAYFYNGFDGSIEGFTVSSVQPIVLIEPNAYYSKYGRTIEETLSFSTSLTALLDSYFLLPQETRGAFLSCCSLFEQGLSLWQSNPSLSFAACVSALETLISQDHKHQPVEKCECCGQEQYRVVQKFRDFFLAYGANTPEFKKFAQKIYKFRSKILHRGELFLGETSPVLFASGDSWDDDDLRRSIVRTCRVCIYNWLARAVGPSDQQFAQ